MFQASIILLSLHWQILAAAYNTCRLSVKTLIEFSVPTSLNPCLAFLYTLITSRFFRVLYSKNPMLIDFFIIYNVAQFVNMSIATTLKFCFDKKHISLSKFTCLLSMGHLKGGEKHAKSNYKYPPKKIWTIGQPITSRNGLAENQTQVTILCDFINFNLIRLKILT